MHPKVDPNRVPITHELLIMLTLEVLVVTIDAQWEGMGDVGHCRVSEVRAGTTSPMPDHKGFKLQ